MLEGVSPGKDYIFRFVLPEVKDLGYISIYDGLKGLFDLYVIQPGDSIKIRMDFEKGMVLFAGKSAKSFQVQHALKQEFQRQLFEINPRFATPNPEEFLAKPGYDSGIQTAKKMYGRHLRVVDRDADTRAYLEEELAKQPADDPMMVLLESYKETIPDPVYQLLRADVLGNFYFEKYHTYYGHAHLFAHWDKNSILKSHLIDIYQEQIASIGSPEVPPSYQVRSKGYLDYALGKVYAEAAGTGTDPLDLISAMSPTLLRDKVLGKHLLNNVQNAGKTEKIIAAFGDQVKDEQIMGMLGTLSQRAKLNQPIPNITLWNPAGDAFPTDSLRGQITLVDFWFTGCKACVDLYTNHLTKVKERYRDHPDFKMVSISVDKKTETWLKSIQSGKYTSEKTLNLQTRGYEHPLLQYLNFSGYPQVIFLDKEGKLQPYEESGLDAASMIRHIDKQINH
jgi:thiol-disulfide isomerase/thioredoxin